ncbi:MAG TPA: gliding motility-associated C-terminal domain-containing protein [Bacteroidia bacterium]|jgi:gliding motility-associated-like protein|nr:gliding motility-associated C-terminal domain-containing protein [Bacteroidia bacterium]
MAMLFIAGTKSAYACHGVGVINPTFTPTASGINIDASSDASTCGCGPYYLQAEVAFTAACLTGNAPACGSPSWNTYPWYFSLLNVPNYTAANGWPDACAVEPYNTITIPYSDLCPGTSYVIRVREFVCGSGSAGGWSFVYTFTTPGIAPTVSVAATANVYTGCPGDPIQLNVSASGGCPGTTYNFSWNPTTGLSNPNIANPVCTLPNANIVYTVTITSQCGAPVAASVDDTVGLTIGPPPNPGVVSGAPLSVCSGGNSTLTLTGQDPSSSVQWQISNNGTTWFNISGATSNSYNTGAISTNLYYQAIVTGSGWWPGSGCGSATSNSVQIAISPAPVVNAGANQTICNGTCANLSGSGGVTYNWQPGNQSTSNITVCPLTTTTYTLTVTDANGCTGTGSVTVNISTPSVTASPDVSICSGNTTILLANGPNGNTYSWSPAGSLTGANTANPTASPLSTTTYTVTATNSFGCTAVDSVMVTVTAPQPLNVSNDTSMCAGGSAVLSVSGATTYSWQPGNMSGSSNTVSPATTTTYVITGSTNNCQSVDSIVVTISPPPNVFAGPDFSICSGAQATLNVAAAGTYQWQPSSSIIGSSTSQSVVINPTSPTSYTITVTGANGCVSTDVVNVGVNAAPNVNATANPAAFCPGGSTTLTATGGTSYQWTPNIALTSTTSASPTASPSNNTTYQVVGTNAAGCTDTATVTVTVFPAPNYFLIPDPTECGDSTGSLTDGGIVSGTAPFTYTIGANTYNSLPITGLASGGYSVLVTDANGCTALENVNIGSVNTATVDGSADTYFGVYPLTVNFTAVGSAGVNTYSWSFGANTQNASFTYTTPGTYTVMVTAYNDLSGCAVYDYLTITVVDQALIALPNVFTPNADGTNDDFAAVVSGVKSIKVEIFNRWGGSVYEGEVQGLASSSQTVALWNGQGGSKATADGVYYYVITAVGYDDKTYPFQGFVQLIQN